MTINRPRDIWGKMTPEERAESEGRLANVAAEGAWRRARHARSAAVDALRAISELPLTRDEAKRCASQVKKLVKELEPIGAAFRKEAGE